MIAFSIHPHIHNKQPFQPSFGYHWTPQRGEISDVRKHVEGGGSFVCAAMTSEHRCNAAFKSAELLAIDIDKTLSIAEFLASPLSKMAAWVYTTASHGRDGTDRFRVIFRLPEVITDGAVYGKVIKLLLEEFEVADDSCSDLCRIFFGNDKAECPLWQPDAVLPKEYLDKARSAACDTNSHYSRIEQDYDDLTLQRARFVLEQIIEPSAEGDRKTFEKVTAASMTAGDTLWDPWCDWASRGHHGSGKNAYRTENKKTFYGFTGTSLGVLFKMANEQDPDWRSKLPAELSSSGEWGIQGGDFFAGYGQADFNGEPEPAEYEVQSTKSIFEANGTTATAVAIRPTHAPEPEIVEADEKSTEVIEPTAKKRKPRKPSTQYDDEEKGVDVVGEIKRRLRVLYPNLRLNLMTQELIYGGLSEPKLIHDISTTYIHISNERHGAEGWPGKNSPFCKTLVYDIASVMGYEQRFHPVKQYLEHCASSSTPCRYFNRLATELLGTPIDEVQNPLMPDGVTRLSDLIMKRFLIGAVARVMNPGCKHDWMPILISGQNAGKTTFFQYLTPPDRNQPGTYPWTSTIQQGIEYLKDRPHALHSGWLVILDEVERYFARRYVNELKNLLSVAVDRSARKYENEKNFPRSFVLAGAANNTDFLTDPTGNRRFLPIVVTGKVASKDNPSLRIIDLDRLKRDRDSIWAAAYQAYFDEPVHNFTSTELSHISGYIDSFTKDNPVESRVKKLLVSNPLILHTWKKRGVEIGRYLLLDEIYEKMDVGIAQHGQMTRPITDALKRMGWAPERVTHEGTQTRAWVRRH